MEAKKRKPASGASTSFSQVRKNLIDLRHHSPAPETEPRPVQPEVGGEIKSDFAGSDFSVNFFDRVLEYGLYLLAFLLPLFLWPSSLPNYEFDKSLLLVLVSSLLLFVWMLDSVFVKGKFRLLKSSLTPAFLLFLLAVFLSACFSVDRATSFLGYYGTSADSFFFTLGLFVFYFLAANQLAAGNSDRIVSRLVSSLVYSALLGAVVSVASALHLRLLPSFPLSAAFNLGSDYVHAFAIYLLAMFFVVVYDFAFLNHFKPVQRAVDVLAGLCILFALLLIGWAPVWPALFLLLVGACLAAGILERKTLASASGALVVLALLVTGALCLTGLDLGRLSAGQVALHNSSLSASLQSALHVDSSSPLAATQDGFSSAEAASIAGASFKAHPLLGSGTGTYAYDFARYKSNAFNYDANWSLRFTKAYDEMLEKVSTLGLLGVIAYALFLLVSLLLLLKVGRKEKRDSILLAAFLTLVVFQFFFLETALLKFLFVVLLLLALGRDLAEEGRFALSATSSRQQKKLLVIDVDRGRLHRLVMPLALVVLLLSAAGVFYSIQFFRAEAAYEKVGQTADPDQIDNSALDRMSALDPYKGEYAVIDSRIRMARIEKRFRTDPTGQSSAQEILAESTKAIASAQRATTLSPGIALFWENYGYIYRHLRLAGMKGAEDPALSGFQQALALDPNNAVYQTEIGKLYLIKYQDTTISAEERAAYLEQAQQQLERAVALKSDYPDATAELALVYTFAGNKDQALQLVNQAEQMKHVSPDAAVLMGRIYYGLQSYAQAEQVLSAVIAKQADNSDAHYVLGVTYKDEQKYASALDEFRTVLKLNPGNEDVTDKIAALEKQVGSSADASSSATSVSSGTDQGLEGGSQASAETNE